MKLAQDKIKKIISIVRYFETSNASGDYSSISLLHDGPNKIQQITYGASQTTEFGNLPILVKMYNEADSTLKGKFTRFLIRLGLKPSLCTNNEFLELLRLAGKIPNLQKIQDDFFKKIYLDPAIAFCDKEGLITPMALLVVYDSYIHSGGVKDYLRERFKANTPANGGNELDWIKGYVGVRDKWLENHTRKILQNTDYRTDSFLNHLQKDDLQLDKEFVILNLKVDNKTIKDIRGKVK